MSGFQETGWESSRSDFEKSLDSITSQAELESLLDRLGKHVLEEGRFRAIADRSVVGTLPYVNSDRFDQYVDTLVISYNFSPFTDASAVTVAKRIRQFGVPVHVVSQNMSGLRTEDAQLTQIVSPYVTRHDQVLFSPSFASWTGVREFVAHAMHELLPRLEAGRYTRIYSRSMFPASHFLAAHIKLKFPSVHWIAEFSDPVQHTVEGVPRTDGLVEVDAWATSLRENAPRSMRHQLFASDSLFAWCEYLVYAYADQVWFTNIYQQHVMLENIDDFEYRKHVIQKSQVHPHPTFPEEFYALETNSAPYRTGKSEKFTIGYFGEFYPNRGLDDLFGAISGIAGSLRQSVSVRVYTSGREACLRRITEAGLEDIVIVNEPLPILEFFSEARMLNRLFVNDVIPGGKYGCNPYLPSKLSDYLGSGTQVIAMVWPGSVMAGTTGLDKFLMGDTFGLGRYIESAILHRQGQP